MTTKPKPSQFDPACVESCLANNPDVAASYVDGTLCPRVSIAEAVAQHTRAFAGWRLVGEQGPELELTTCDPLR